MAGIEMHDISLDACSTGQADPHVRQCAACASLPHLLQFTLTFLQPLPRFAVLRLKARRGGAGHISKARYAGGICLAGVPQIACSCPARMRRQ